MTQRTSPRAAPHGANLYGTVECRCAHPGCDVRWYASARVWHQPPSMKRKSMCAIHSIPGVTRLDPGEFRRRCTQPLLHSHWRERIAGGVHCAECGEFVTAAWVRCQDARPVCDPCERGKGLDG